MAVVGRSLLDSRFYPPSFSPVFPLSKSKIFVLPGTAHSVLNIKLLRRATVSEFHTN
jgi:hypothetical protein